jgi:glycosyl transferase family 1
MRRVLFVRRFRGLTGGHVKVRDYFGHVGASATHDARIWFTRDSSWGEGNPWHDVKHRVVASPREARPDVMFLAGLDWTLVDGGAERDLPVVNLVQHVRHADLHDPRRAFLARRAVRICVSAEVADAISAVRPRGPVIAIPNGLDLAGLPEPRAPEARDADVLVAGAKRPGLARRVAERLCRPGRRVVLLDSRVERSLFLAWLARTRVAVLLPNPREGFFLPALESMALGAATVVPDCVGNRGYCRDGISALVPDATEDALSDAAERALRMDAEEARRLAAGARAVVAQHSAERERRAFLDVLADLDRLWATSA